MRTRVTRCVVTYPALFVCVVLLSACSSARPTPVDAGNRDAAPLDMHAVDAGELDGALADASTCIDPLSPPTSPLRPEAGELFYAQIGLGGFSMGEAALIVGPSGTVVLVDVANDSHDDDIADVLETFTGSMRVDDIVITHFHADHADGIADLLSRVTLTGRIVYRGFTDLTSAANEATVDTLCNVLAENPSANAPLCSAATDAPCQASERSGSYPAIACEGLETEDLDLGWGASLNFLAANGVIGGERYESGDTRINASDSNGENARSVVALLSHGAFRMMLAGDLTGGGSDTDDLETFYASRLSSIPALGVDVLHAGHHGRDTSSNANYLARLVPSDGRDRNVLMGISTAHLGSPHSAALSALVGDERLAHGRVWTTLVSAGGATAPELVDAGGGLILVATRNSGSTYVVQAIGGDGSVLESRAFRSVDACP